MRTMACLLLIVPFLSGPAFADEISTGERVRLSRPGGAREACVAPTLGRPRFMAVA